MTDPHPPDDDASGADGESSSDDRKGTVEGGEPSSAGRSDGRDDGRDPSGSDADRAGAGDHGDARDGDHDHDDKGRDDKGRTKLTKEQAREAAEAEKAAREARALEEALELARADAERMLAGPGLVNPEPPIPAADLEADWSDQARAAVQRVRDDLHQHKVGLAISGGGSLGSFEAGVLRFLYDHVGIDPVAICGNSAGALNAAKLAEGRHHDRNPIDEVERIWRSLRINSDMWEPEPWLVRLQASASWAAELREQVSDSDSATSAVRVAVRVVGSLVRRPPETDGTIDAIKEAIRAQSLLSLSPVAELVERELNPERVRASGIALRMGTVSLEAGELRYVTETGALHDRHDQPVVDQPTVPLASGVLASASIPMAFPPVEMNGEHYVDGGAREILPLELLVTRMGAERVIAISASSASIKRSASFADRNLLDILRRVSAEIAPNETLRKELNPPGGWHPHVRLVVPQFNVHDSMTIDPALIAISLDHGYLRAADVLLALGPEASELTEQISRLRVRLRHLAGPVPSIFDTTLGRDRRERLDPGRPADPEVIEVDVVHADDEDGDGEGRGSTADAVRSARNRVAKLVKVIGRDHTDRDELHPDGDGLHVRPDGTTNALTIEVDVPEAGGADVEIREVDGSVTVVVGPHGATPPHDAGSTGGGSATDRERDPAPSDEPADEGDDEQPRTGQTAPVGPGADDDEGGDGDQDRGEGKGEERGEGKGEDRDEDEDESDEVDTEAEAEAARQAEAEEITRELRQLCRRRHDLGAPLPQTLLAWLRASDAGAAAGADDTGGRGVTDPAGAAADSERLTASPGG